jgi:tetratricopeptide (TPR) repeat protein
LGRFFDHYKRPDSAAFYYEKALEVTPDLGVGWKLAYVYARRERYDEAIRALDRDFGQLQLTEGRRINSQVMKAGYLTWLGRLDSAQSLLVRIDSMALRLGMEGEIGPLVHAGLADIAATRGRYTEARAQTNQSCTLGRTQPWLVTYAHASKALRAMIDGSDELYSAWIDTRQHLYQSARRRLQRSHELFAAASVYAQAAESRWAVVRVEYLVAIDSVDTALALAARALPRKAPCLCGYENFPDLMPSIMPFTHKGDVVALAWLRKGDLRKAIAEYELLTNPDSIGYTLIDPRWHYDLAKLYEHAGEKAKAVERYEKFLRLWKDADGDLPQPADARARLARLKRE